MRLVLSLALVVFLASPAAGQEPATCPEFKGIVCDGWVTDSAGVITDDTRPTEAVDRIIGRFGHEIAVRVQRQLPS